MAELLVSGETGVERLQVDSNRELLPVFPSLPPNTIHIRSLPPQQLEHIRHSPLAMTLSSTLSAVVRAFAFNGNEWPAKQQFTAFFVAPRILVTARHNLYRKDNATRYEKFRMSQVEDSDGCFIIFSDATVLYEPPSPMPASLGPDRDDVAIPDDFALLQVASGGYVSPLYLEPSTEVPEENQFIFTIQFNGKPTDKWLKKQKALIEEETKRTYDANIILIGNALYTDQQSISFGPIKKVQDGSVYYASTTGPGSSGAPCFVPTDKSDGRLPQKFCAIHCGSYKPFRQYNRGVLVGSEFMKAYTALVVPNLEMPAAKKEEKEG